MAEHPNVELVREGYEAFARGDMDWMREHLAQDIVWHVPGNNPLSGDHTGLDQVLGMFGKLMELTGGSFQQEIHDIVGGDEHVVVLVSGRAERPDGRSLENRSVQIFHVKEGKAIEYWIFNEDQAASDAFMS